MADFTISEISILTNLSYKKLLRCIYAFYKDGQTVYYTGDLHKNGIKYSRSNTSEFKDLYIYKYTDEWFLVNARDGKYYKCDQLEGLITLLNDITYE